MGLHAGSFFIYIVSIAIYYTFAFNYYLSNRGEQRIRAFNTMCYAWQVSELCSFVSQLLLIYIFIQIAKGQSMEYEEEQDPEMTSVGMPLSRDTAREQDKQGDTS
jgi:hypothetical protein